MFKKIAAILAWGVLTMSLTSPAIATSTTELLGQFVGAAALAGVVVYALAYSIPAKVRGWRAAGADR